MFCSPSSAVESSSQNDPKRCCYISLFFCSQREWSKNQTRRKNQVPTEHTSLKLLNKTKLKLWESLMQSKKPGKKRTNYRRLQKLKVVHYCNWNPNWSIVWSEKTSHKVVHIQLSPEEPSFQPLRLNETFPLYFLMYCCSQPHCSQGRSSQIALVRQLTNVYFLGG